MAEIAVLRTHIINYSKTREVYVAYRKAEYSKNFLAEHEADILLHKTTKKAFDELGLKKIPTVKSLQAEYAQPHDAIVRSKGAWGTSLNKHLEAIWIAKSIACQYVSKSYNRNSQKISNYKIKIHFRVNSIAFKKKKDYTNYEGNDMILPK